MRPENRWWVVAIFYLSSSINYLDRMILNAISPEFMREYHLNYEQFGWIHTPFYVVYMISSPCLGWFLDRVGLNWRIPNVHGKRAIRHVVYDTNWWKSFINARLRVAMGDRGCLSLFGTNAETHRMLSEHLTSEYFLSDSDRVHRDRTNDGIAVRIAS